MTTFTKDFDTLLNKIDHFRKYPAMKPYIGINYNQCSRKILFIGESHYFPENSQFHKNAEQWYASDQSALKDYYEKHKNEIKENPVHSINPRGIIESDWKGKGHMFFKEINDTLINHFDNHNIKAISNTAFMNAFQRPALENGGSIKAHIKKQDLDVSVDVVSQVISIIKPELVIFVSKFTSDKIRNKLKSKFSNVKFEYVCHPATGGRYWHNNKYKHNKNKLIGILDQQFQ